MAILAAVEAAGTLDDDSPRSAPPRDDGRPPFDVLYRPPTFVARNRPVELEFEVVCPLTGPPPPRFCSPGGTLHVRRVGASTFDRIPLRSASHRATAVVPARYTVGAGFDYFVDLRDERGNRRTIPRAGRAAPQRAWSVERWTSIALGKHRFGRARSGRALVEAGWGTGLRELGLRRRIGPSAFDLAPDGTLVVLDQHNRRLAVYAPGPASPPTHTRVSFVGGEGDVAVGPDGTVYVLDGGKPRTHVAFVRSYGPALQPLATTRLAEAPSGMLRAGASGAFVFAFPSGQWMPLGRGARLLRPDEQAAAARAGRPVSATTELAVGGSPFALQLALFAGDRVRGAWRIATATRFGEVQVAEQYRGGLLVVVRVHSVGRVEWLVLELRPNGLRREFAVAPVEWAETAPASRFRLREDTLYALESSPRGVRILRYGLR